MASSIIMTFHAERWQELDSLALLRVDSFNPGCRSNAPGVLLEIILLIIIRHITRAKKDLQHPQKVNSIFQPKQSKPTRKWKADLLRPHHLKAPFASRAAHLKLQARLCHFDLLITQPSLKNQSAKLNIETYSTSSNWNESLEEGLKRLRGKRYFSTQSDRKQAAVCSATNCKGRKPCSAAWAGLIWELVCPMQMCKCVSSQCDRDIPWAHCPNNSWEVCWPSHHLYV